MAPPPGSATALPAPGPFCRYCGAGRSPEQTVCWLCHTPYDAALPPAAAPSRPPHPATSPSQFSIATILLVTTLAAVCLGVFRLEPGLGILLAIFALPALVRTAFVGRREQRCGQKLTTGGKIGQFFLSLAVIYAAWTAASMAFAVAVMGTCFAAVAVERGSGESGMVILIGGLIFGVIAGLAIGSVILWATWPKRT